VSFGYSLTDGQAESRHRTQYFEMLGHRSIYHDGWRAVCPWPGPSFAEAGKGFGEPIPARTLTDLDAHGWELYHVAEDFAECHDVADGNRDTLIALIATWYAEAGKYDVFPVDGSGLARLGHPQPLVAPPRSSYTFYPNTQSVPFFAGPRLLNRPHSISATVRLPDEGAEGVLLAQGTAAGGFSFYVQDGRLRYVHNWVGRERFEVTSTEAVPPGDHELRFEFEPQGEPDPAYGHGMPGRFQLYVDNALVGAREVPWTTPFMFNPGAMTCGADPGSTVTTAYAAPFRFTGTLHQVTVDLSGELIQDKESELRAAMARQ
jgi:arylsulfatase